MGDTSKYSLLSLLRHGTGKPWHRQWRDAEPRAAYDVVIVGAGGHGLATAFYLAFDHGIRSIAVLDKGWLGGGNTGRNTTIIRSNYLHYPKTLRFGYRTAPRRSATLFCRKGRRARKR